MTAGFSIFSIDPGETTGWAWACLGRKELETYGIGGALERARADVARDTYDSRFMKGEIGLNFARWQGREDAYVKAEMEAAHEVFYTSLVMSGMGSRMTNGIMPGLTHVVIEDFILRRQEKTRELLAPVRMTAYLRLLYEKATSQVAGAYGRREEVDSRNSTLLDISFVMQQPSDAKAIVTDDRLEGMGGDLRKATAGQVHARDAVRHLVLCLKRLQSTTWGKVPTAV